MEDSFDRFIVWPLRSFADRVLQLLPNLIAAFLILVVGFIAGWLTKVFLKRFFTIIRMDDFAERIGMTAILAKGGLHEPSSQFLARLASGFVIFVFFLASLNSLEVNLIQGLVERFFHYLPNIFIAAAVMVLAYMLGNFFGRAALIASVNAGITVSGLIGKGVKVLVVVIGVIMALEQLGIGQETVIVTFAIVFSGIVLALAIAFGLGGKDVARNYLERRLGGKTDEEEDDIRHL